MDYLTTHTSLSPIRRGFAPGFVNYKKGCTRLAAVSDKVYRLLAHGRWFSPGTPASSTTKTGRNDIAEIMLKVALNTKNQSINLINFHKLPNPSLVLIIVMFYVIELLYMNIFYPLQSNLALPNAKLTIFEKRKKIY